MLDRLAQIGWNHPLLATIQLGGDRPKPAVDDHRRDRSRAVSFSVRGDRGIDVQSSIDTATPSAGAELAKLLDEKRTSVPDLQALAGPDLGTQLATVARDATIKAELVTGQVAIGVHVSSDALDAVIRAAEQSGPLTDMYKTFRLVQLLAPSH